MRPYNSKRIIVFSICLLFIFIGTGFASEKTFEKYSDHGTVSHPEPVVYRLSLTASTQMEVKTRSDFPTDIVVSVRDKTTGSLKPLIKSTDKEIHSLEGFVSVSPSGADVEVSVVKSEKRAKSNPKRLVRYDMEILWTVPDEKPVVKNEEKKYSYDQIDFATATPKTNDRFEYKYESNEKKSYVKETGEIDLEAYVAEIRRKRDMERQDALSLSGKWETYEGNKRIVLEFVPEKNEMILHSDEYGDVMSIVFTMYNVVKNPDGRLDMIISVKNAYVTNKSSNMRTEINTGDSKKSTNTIRFDSQGNMFMKAKKEIGPLKKIF